MPRISVPSSSTRASFLREGSWNGTVDDHACRIHTQISVDCGGAQCADGSMAYGVRYRSVWMPYGGNVGIENETISVALRRVWKVTAVAVQSGGW